MTRKDYELIATCLQAEREDWPETPATQTSHERVECKAARMALNGFELRIQNELEIDNPNFNRKRFADASGFDGKLPQPETVGERGVW